MMDDDFSSKKTLNSKETFNKEEDLDNKSKDTDKQNTFDETNTTTHKKRYSSDENNHHRNRDRYDENYYGGGKRGRGYHNRGRKRNFNDRRGGYSRGGPPRKKRRFKKPEPELTHEEKIQQGISELLIHIADKGPASAERNLAKLPSVLNEDIPHHSEFIRKTVLECVMKYGIKVPVYATLVGLLNVDNTEFSKSVVNDSHALLQKYLSNGDWHRSKLLTRFQCELLNANVIDPLDVVQLLRYIISFAKDKNLDSHLRDCYAYVVMGNMLWVGRELDNRRPDDLSEIVEDLALYMRTRSTEGHDLNRIYPKDQQQQKEQEDDDHDDDNDSDDEEKHQVDFTEYMWSAIMKCKRQDWRASAIMKPYLSFDSELSHCETHKLPELSIKPEESHLPGLNTLFRTRLNIFDRISWSDEEETDSAARHRRNRDEEVDSDILSDDSDSDLIPEVGIVDRFIVEDAVDDILYTFNDEHQKGAAYLLKLPLKFSADHIVLETILSHMFCLPNSQFSQLYYNIILFDFRASGHRKISFLLTKCLNFIFKEIHKFDAEIVDRFSNFMAYYLSNFDFGRNWKHWEKAVGYRADETNPDTSKNNRQAAFLRHMLAAWVRLTRQAHVREHLPSKLHAFIPPNPTPMYSYATADSSHHTIAQGILEVIKQEGEDGNVEEVETLLQSIHAPSSIKEGDDDIDMEAIDTDNESGDGTIHTRIDVLIQVLLLAGSQGTLKLLKLFEAYQGVLKKLVASSPDSELGVVRSVLGFWENPPQQATTAITKLWSLGVFKAESVIKFVFSKDMVHKLDDGIHWQILDSCVVHICERIRGCYGDIKRAIDFMNTDKRKKFLEASAQKAKETNETYQELLSERQHMFRVLVTTFADSITQYLKSNEEENANTNLWFKHVMQRFISILRRFKSFISEDMDDIVDTVRDSGANATVVEYLEKACHLPYLATMVGKKANYAEPVLTPQMLSERLEEAINNSQETITKLEEEKQRAEEEEEAEKQKQAELEESKNNSENEAEKSKEMEKEPDKLPNQEE
eukprot:gb/GECH01014435.1/.p1 GENE.gb/GECH01014435.1/~~gb/GECH01014435.1/.p1  ORF type:complete len:1031 (+),score=277.08 gb/GECH01014435.1/:1-3093(+)